MSQQPKQPDLYDSENDDPAGDPPTGTYIAPDEPMGSHSYGTTSSEERRGETFDERTKHTNPEDMPGDDPSRVGALLQDGDEDVDVTDGEASMYAWAEGDEGDLSAEEEAMHTTDRP